MTGKQNQDSIRKTGLKFSMAIAPDACRDELLFAKQLGFDCVYTWIDDDRMDYESLKELREKIEDAGLMLYNVGHKSLGKCDRIHLALPGRDSEIERFKNFVYNLGRAGINTTTFTWEPTRVWTTETVPHANSRWAETRIVDLEEVMSRPFTHGRKFTEDEIWNNFKFFIDEMIPVSKEAGVRLALHPNDPPAPCYGGIPSLIHNSQCYERAFEIADSPYLGMEFCTGCWLEGGKAFGDIIEGIRSFNAQKRIFIVHFRNVSSSMPYFVETFLDNGYMSMYSIMKTLVETGYEGTVTLDHTPRFAGDYAKGGGQAYAMGYMRALLERAKDELKLNCIKTIKVSEEDPDSPDAHLLMDELSGTLESITGSSGRNSFDPRDVSGPRAVFAIARNQAGEAVGCGALRPIDENTAEVKRMYARHKGMGIGTEILSYLERRAQLLGYTALRLETRLVNQQAVSFYESRGYQRIPNYGRYAGRQEAVCFEKCLEE